MILEAKSLISDMVLPQVIGQVGPQARNIIFNVQRRMPGSRLCSWALMWLEPGAAFHGAIILTCFAWLLSFPSWE
jgi:hypothetical protein